MTDLLVTDGLVAVARVPSPQAAETLATASLLAAMRLASPALPIGGFSYSQGLESAIERGWVRNESEAADWIGDLLALNVGRFDAPLLMAMAVAAHALDWTTMLQLHDLHLATRESGEQHAESLQMGYSLVSLLEGLHPPAAGLAEAWDAMATLSPGFAASLPWAWALAGRAFELTPAQTTTAFLWSWLENQVMVTLKAVPLGQQAGQRMMSRLLPSLAATVATAAGLPREHWSNHAPGFALAACWHETQYSRMFRS